LLKVSIIQGRLSPRPFPKLQEFPAKTWANEFVLAEQLGFFSIEWIFALNDFEHNPIWSNEGRKKIRDIASTVQVKSVCADYFLESPFYRVPSDIRKKNISILRELISRSAEIGVESILLPVLETAEINTAEERELFIDAIGQCLPTLEKNGIRLGFEAELPAHEYLELVSVFNSPFIGAYYDAGNCAAKGYSTKEDFIILSDKLLNIHIKDRPVNGQSTYLGEGAANFEEALPILIKQEFKGLLVLQSYFGEDYLNDAVRNKKYIDDILGRGLI
jgi:hexulose-6-phosphate isomerase